MALLTPPRSRDAPGRATRPRLEALEGRAAPAVQPLSGHLILERYNDGAGMGSVFQS